MGIVGALIGAAIGAVVWGLLGAKVSIELGFVAWGVGLVVGGLSYFFGGRGITNGVLCGIITLLGIFAGKILIYKFGGETAALGDIIEKGVMERLDAMDLLFAGLGVVTAFQLGGRMEAEAPTYSPQQMAYQPPTPAAGDQQIPSAQPYQPYGSPTQHPAEEEPPAQQQPPQ